MPLPANRSRTVFKVDSRRRMNDQPRIGNAFENLHPEVKRGPNLGKIVQAAEGNVSRRVNRNRRRLGRRAARAVTPISLGQPDSLFAVK